MQSVEDVRLPLHERLRALRLAAELSQPELFRRTQGVSLSTLIGAEYPPASQKHRYPTRHTLEQIARACEVDPLLIPEYRLALARRLFDERDPEVGPQAALANATRLEAALASGMGGARKAARASQRTRRARTTSATKPRS